MRQEALGAVSFGRVSVLFLFLPETIFFYFFRFFHFKMKNIVLTLRNQKGYRISKCEMCEKKTNVFHSRALASTSGYCSRELKRNFHYRLPFSRTSMRD